MSDLIQFWQLLLLAMIAYYVLRIFTILEVWAEAWGKDHKP